LYDNLDPQHFGLTPTSLGLQVTEDKSGMKDRWENVDDWIGVDRIKKTYMTSLMQDLLSGRAKIGKPRKEGENKGVVKKEKVKEKEKGKEGDGDGEDGGEEEDAENKLKNIQVDAVVDILLSHCTLITENRVGGGWRLIH